MQEPDTVSEEQGVVITNAAFQCSSIQMWEPMELRVLESYYNGSLVGKKLQQRWVDRASGEQEWRDIPTEREETESEDV